MEVNIVRLAVIWLQQVESKYQDKLPDKLYEAEIEVLMDFWKKLLEKESWVTNSNNYRKKDYSIFAWADQLSLAAKPKSWVLLRVHP